MNSKPKTPGATSSINHGLNPWKILFTESHFHLLLPIDISYLRNKGEFSLNFKRMLKEFEPVCLHALQSLFVRNC